MRPSPGTARVVARSPLMTAARPRTDPGRRPVNATPDDGGHLGRLIRDCVDSELADLELSPDFLARLTTIPTFAAHRPALYHRELSNCGAPTMIVEPRPVETPSPHTATELVVVTGVCGFIGSHLAETLLARPGVSVLGVDRINPDHDPRTAEVIADLLGRPGFELLSADAGDAAVASYLGEAAAVVHLAAPTDVAASWGAGFSDQAASLLSSQRLLDNCWTAQVPRMVVASSAHVYGPGGDLVREDVPAEPTSPYGVVKLATERLAVAYARRPGSAMSTVALRFFTAFGPRVNPAMVVPRMFRSALSGQAMPQFGDGTALHSWTHVYDLVGAIMSGIDVGLEAGRGEVVNAAGPDTASLRQVGDLVGQIVGRPVMWEPAGARAGDAAGVRADLARARQVLGFEPRISLREGLEALWLHLAENGAQPAAIPASRR